MIVSSRQVWVISRPQVRQVSPQVPQVYQASMYCRGGPLHSSWVQRLLFAAWTTLPWNINFFKKNNETMKGVGSNYSHTLAQKVQLSRFQEHALNVCWNLIYNVSRVHTGFSDKSFSTKSWSRTYIPQKLIHVKQFYFSI